MKKITSLDTSKLRRPLLSRRPRSFESLCSVFSVPIIKCDAAGKILDANPAALDFYQLSLNELNCYKVSELHTSGPEPDSFKRGVWYYKSPNMSIKHLMVFDEVQDKKTGTTCLVFKDISIGVRAYTDTIESAHQYRSIFEHANEGIFQSRVEGGYTLVNQALAQMYGFLSASEMMSELTDISGSLYVDPNRRVEFIDTVLRDGYVTNFESEIYRADGGRIWISENARCVRDINGDVQYFEGFVENITERKAIEAEREEMLNEAIERADHDPLTGLLNHRAFHKRLAEEAERAARDGSSFAVAVLDLDNFKFFNDSYGHSAGDSVLNTVASLLRSESRLYDILARFGGDEFAILMPGLTKSSVAEFQVRAKRALEHAGYQPEGYDSTIPLGVSVGIAVFPDDSTVRTELIDLADRRLRAAKSGGNQELLCERLRTVYSDSITGFKILDALVTSVDNKDRYTRRHSEDVSYYAVQIARHLELDDMFIQHIQVTGLIHDIGKIGVPDYILRKPGKLTPEEFDAIRQHAEMGAMIVCAAPDLSFALDGVHHHHERWDGTGYPDQLAGDEIPLMARILAVADGYSAMTTNRPYRTSMSASMALEIINDGAGTQWDPECVAAFLSIMEMGEKPAEQRKAA